MLNQAPTVNSENLMQCRTEGLGFDILCIVHLTISRVYHFI